MDPSIRRYQLVQGGLLAVTLSSCVEDSPLLTIRTSPGMTACAGERARQEQFLYEAFDALGADVPHASYELLVFDLATHAQETPCVTAACAFSSKAAASASPPADRHELMHLVVGSVTAQRSIGLLDEGIADLLGRGYDHQVVYPTPIPSLTELANRPPVGWREESGDSRLSAVSFAQHFAATYSLAALLEVYERTPRRGGAEALDAALQDVVGLSLEEVERGWLTPPYEVYQYTSCVDVDAPVLRPPFEITGEVDCSAEDAYGYLDTVDRRRRPFVTYELEITEPGSYEVEFSGRDFTVIRCSPFKYGEWGFKMNYSPLMPFTRPATYVLRVDAGEDGGPFSLAMRPLTPPE